MAAIKRPTRQEINVKASSGFRLGSGSVATRQSAITAPTGGATIDAQARTAINDVITVLEAFGLVTAN